MPTDWLKSERAAAQREGRSVYLKELAQHVDEQMLQKAFQIPAVQDFGDITDIKIMFDPDTHSSRGFGFVNFTKASSALEAVSRMHGSSFEGKRLYAAINESNRIRMGKPGAGKSDFVGSGTIQYDQKANHDSQEDLTSRMRNLGPMVTEKTRRFSESQQHQHYVGALQKKNEEQNFFQETNEPMTDLIPPGIYVGMRSERRRNVSEKGIPGAPESDPPAWPEADACIPVITSNNAARNVGDGNAAQPAPLPPPPCHPPGSTSTPPQLHSFVPDIRDVTPIEPPGGLRLRLPPARACSGLTAVCSGISPTNFDWPATESGPPAPKAQTRRQSSDRTSSVDTQQWASVQSSLDPFLSDQERPSGHDFRYSSNPGQELAMSDLVAAFAQQSIHESAASTNQADADQPSMSDVQPGVLNWFGQNSRNASTNGQPNNDNRAQHDPRSAEAVFKADSADMQNTALQQQLADVLYPCLRIMLIKQHNYSEPSVDQIASKVTSMLIDHSRLSTPSGQTMISLFDDLGEFTKQVHDHIGGMLKTCLEEIHGNQRRQIDARP